MHQHVCQHNSLSLCAYASMVISPISTNMPVVTPKDGKSTTTYHAATRRWRHTMVVSQANQSRQNGGRRIFSCSPSPPRCHHPRGHHTNHLPERSKSETLLNLCPRVYVNVRIQCQQPVLSVPACAWFCAGSDADACGRSLWYCHAYGYHSRPV